ncbi:FadR/GntR family transcriptional regulator [Leucobacter sp. wl10]|uniref:FadR/GntR family transcriptional regulator n=1 Tax=Leucobacter sp. wl10 TaxID=2304677 RepID=UPI0013C36533|nr:FadR/GntR family transcriptional regulator [Leucobacter sp. wl10]
MSSTDQPHRAPQRPKRLPEIVADQLQEYILSNGLSAGDRLPTEPALTEMYEVSRQVVREAARLLEQRGVVEIRAGRGMSVADVSVDRVHDIYRLFLRFKPENFQDLLATRLVLEPGTAALAATQRSEEDIARMRETLQASKSLASDAFSEHLALDLEFHRRVSDACHNPFLIALSTPINESLREVYAEPIAYLSSLPRTHAEHETILEAIAAGDEEAARTATVAHLGRVRDEARKLIPDAG